MFRTITFGDLAHLFQRGGQMADLKSRIAQSATEVTTGLVADSSRHLTQRAAGLASIETTLTRLGAYARAATDTGLRLDLATTALNAIEEQSADLSVELMKVTPSASTATLGALANDAAERFSSAIGFLNTRFAGQSVFAGVAVDQAALIPAAAVLDALEGVVAGAVSAADVEAAVSDWFDDPGGFLAVAYQGGAAVPPVPLSATESSAASVTAADPGLREALKGLATAALLSRDVLPGQPEARGQLARRAGERLFAAIPALTAVTAGLGLQAGRAETLLTQSEAESSALQIARAGLIGADPFASASALEGAQTQLESVFAITARMSRLNLMDFLR